MGYRVLHRLATLAAFGLGVTGCTRWQVETRPIPELLADSVEALRVTRDDSGRVVVYSPIPVGDSLAGTGSPWPPSEQSPGSSGSSATSR